MQNKRRLISLKILLLLYTLTIISFLAYSFFFGFDITDEGYHLYLNQQGFHGKGNYFFSHYLTHFIGEAFGHKVIGYRFTSLFIIFFTSIILSNLIISTASANGYFNNHSYKTVLILQTLLISLTYYNSLASISYTFTATMAAAFWIISIFLCYIGMQAKKNFYTIGLVGIIISVYLALLGRPPYGLTLLAVTYFTLKSFSTNKATFFKFIIPYLASPIIMFIATILIAADKEKTLFRFILDGYKVFSSHPGEYGFSSLFNKYFHDFVAIIIYAFPFLIIFCILNKVIVRIKSYKIFQLLSPLNLNQKLYLCLTTLIPIGIYLHTNGSQPLSEKISKFNTIYITLLTLYILFSAIEQRRKKRNSSNSNLIFYLLLAIFLTPLGTSDGFFERFSMNSVAIGALFTYTSHSLAREKHLIIHHHIISTILFTLAISTVYVQQYAFGIRQASHKELKFKSENSLPLSTIRLDKDLQHTIDRLHQKLEEHNFDFKHDKIFAYANIPGLLSSLNIKSFGESWVYNSEVLRSNTNHFVENFRGRACHHIKSESLKRDDNIYILSIQKELPKEVTTCLSKRIVLRKSPLTPIGSIYLHREEARFPLYLSGPFYPTKDRL